jgi:hypothetical protein
MFVGTTHLSLASITLFVVGLHTALYLSILMLGLACVASLMARPVPSSDESTHGALVQRLEELG